MIDKSKILFILFILWISLFASLGYFFNKNKADEWDLKYGYDINSTFKIHANSVDKVMYELNVTADNHESLINFVNNKILRKNLELNLSFTDIRNIAVLKELITFQISDISEAEKKLYKIVNETNKLLKYEIINYLDIYIENAISRIENEKKFKIEDLERTIEFYRNNESLLSRPLPSGTMEKIGESSLTADLVIDTILFDKLKDDLREELTELIAYEKYFSIGNMELTLDKLLNIPTSADLKLTEFIDLKNKINSLDLIIIKGITYKINRKPSAPNSIIGFAFLGFLIWFISYFLYLNQIFLKSVKPKKLLILPRLK